MILTCRMFRLYYADLALSSSGLGRVVLSHQTGVRFPVALLGLMICIKKLLLLKTPNKQIETGPHHSSVLGCLRSICIGWLIAGAIIAVNPAIKIIALRIIGSPVLKNAFAAILVGDSNFALLDCSFNRPVSACPALRCGAI